MRFLRFNFQLICLLASIWSAPPLLSQEGQRTISYTGLGFTELIELEDELEQIGDTLTLKKVLRWHLLKAKTVRDTAEVLETYKWLSTTSNYTTGIQLLDSALHFNQRYSGFHEHFGNLNYRKAVKHYKADRPVRCFKSALIALEHARKHGPESLYLECLNLIAVLKMEYGQEHEALRLQQSSLKVLLKLHDKLSNFDRLYAGALDGLAIGYIHTGRYDSARVVARQGLEFSREIDFEDFDRNFRLLLAQINYYDGNLLKARDSLEQLTNSYQGTARADIYYYLGMIAGRLGNPKVKRNYFQEIDTILSASELPYLDSANEVYTYLLQDAVMEKKPLNQSRYLEMWRFTDSLVQLRELQVRSISHARFEQQMREIVYPTRPGKTSYGLIWFLSLTGLAFSGVYALIRLRHSKHMIRSSSTAPKESGITGLDMRTERKILEALKGWERDKGFLDTEVSLNTLAKRLSTNSAYLSRIINVHKGMSFANYIKDLRLKSALDFIHKNPEAAARMSTIQLAEHFGFKSQDVFVRSLKSRTGMTPSKYLKNIT